MLSGKPQSKAQLKNTDSKVDPSGTVVDSIRTIENWIDRELKVLVEENADWQTTCSNRKYFGR